MNFLSEKESLLEENHNYNQTILCSLIEKKKFKEATERCKSNPEEASQWIIKNVGDKVKSKENNNDITWRLLPLHIAIMIRANDDLIRALIDAHPNGVKELDDQGMLPVHLAFRHSANEAILDLLLEIYPDGMSVQDNRGRFPLQLIPTNNKKGNSFRTFACNLTKQQQQQNSTAEDESTSALKIDLAEAYKKISDLEEKQIQTENKENQCPNHDYEEQIDELEMKLKNSTQSYDHIVSILENRKATHANEKSFLEDQIKCVTESQDNALLMLKRAQEEHEKTVAILKKRNREARDDVVQSRKLTAELLSSLELLTKSSEEEKQAAEAMISECTEKLLKKEQETHFLRGNVDEMEKEMISCKSTVEDLNLILQSERSKSDGLSQEVKILKSRIDMQSNELDTMRSMMKDLYDEKENSNSEFDEMKKDYEEQINTLKHSLQDCKQKNKEETSAKVDAFNEELAAKKEKYSREVATFEATIERLNAEVAGLKQDYEELKNTHNETSIDLKAQVESSTSQCKELMESLNELEQEKTATEKSHMEQISSLKGTIEEMTEKDAEWNRKMNRNSLELISMIDSCDHLAEGVEKLTAEKRDLTDDIEKYKTDYAELQNRHEEARIDFEDQIDSLTVQCEKHLNRCHELEEKTNESEKRNQGEIASLNCSIQEMTNKDVELNQKLIKQNNELMKMVTTCDKLVDEMNKLQEESTTAAEEYELQLNASRTIADQMSQQLEQARNEYKEIITEYENKIAEQTDKHQSTVKKMTMSFETEKESLHAEVRRTTNSYSNIQIRLQKTQSERHTEIVELNKSLLASEQHISSLENTISEMKTKSKELQQELSRRSAEFVTLSENAKSTHETELELLKDKVLSMESLRNIADERIRALEKEVAHAKHQHQVEQTKTISYLSIVDDLKAQMEVTSEKLCTQQIIYGSDLEEAHSMIDALQNQVTLCDEDICQKDNRIKALMEQLESQKVVAGKDIVLLKKQIDALKSERNDSKITIEELRTELVHLLNEYDEPKCTLNVLKSHSSISEKENHYPRMSKRFFDNRQ